ncbi:hypothetical protein EHI8A_006170 [Entamoeba histolytica HM-1:IMSS-B]|uniref:Uncharacterized protein n=6 Tax=Entamoeba histolytica TaxID=5759 RepID=C4LX07_ENTH1|nr:hypothetical protein EHI_127350 [Entamoeba histolytica HM-1:IMSS]EMD44746.1 Hypothetical protein EHI5A_016730 [Entamoeba histolytica KU27]EMH75649.1 hypothetical protein EHI8A_006170 [Entamoeba histolytica HM-1:IMSS-B]EMS12135.1 hypothetical protein KM1_018550 [Entamoeba histolytica HM-3:IMSS]ENY65214.1 hypothetical protein EHI7A_007020 [Entamoeba histolytica HM-1:IMSS-A]GAT93257.1 hypothetical protein CL6EHI_127350 [Entamoeba histolytica]|eukprot:XP_652307.1 hypothetical protein EHI_127350 [Entamoeba histolytica HM-1:IMSS]
MGQEVTKPQIKNVVPKEIIEALKRNKLPEKEFIQKIETPNILMPILFEYFFKRKAFIEERQEKLLVKMERVEKMNKLCLGMAVEAPKKMSGMVELPNKVKQALDSLKLIEKRVSIIQEHTKQIKVTLMFIKKNVLQ